MDAISNCAICGPTKEKTFSFPNTSSKADSKIRFFEWVDFAGIKEKVSLNKVWFLCHRHFTASSFQTSERKKLLRNAIPTQHPPSDLSVQTTISLSFRGGQSVLMKPGHCGIASTAGGSNKLVPGYLLDHSYAKVPPPCLKTILTNKPSTQHVTLEPESPPSIIYHGEPCDNPLVISARSARKPELTNPVHSR